MKNDHDIDGDVTYSNFTLDIKNTDPQIITTDQVTVFEDEPYFVDYNSTDDDDIVVYADENKSSSLEVLSHLRQQTEKPPGKANNCLADLVPGIAAILRECYSGM